VDEGSTENTDNTSTDGVPQSAEVEVVEIDAKEIPSNSEVDSEETKAQNDVKL